MAQIAKTLVIQGIELPLRVDESEVQLLVNAAESINQAVKNVNQGHDLDLPPTKQVRLFLYGILQLIYSMQLTHSVPKDLERQLENLLKFANDCLDEKNI